MIKEKLAKDEKVIYNSLVNALSNHKLGHSFLLAGPSNPLKEEMAILLAQTIVSEKDELACEECETCLRIAKNEYYDVILVDGEKSSIKKEDILNIYHRFSKTALEKKNHVYILKNVENASVKVMNMILKYMEEPNDNIYAILTTDHKELLLDTIISRCVVYNFHSINYDTLIKMYLDDGFDELDAYLLSHIHHEYHKTELDDKAYLLAKDMMDITLNNYDHFEMIESIFNLEYYNKIKDRDILSQAIDQYLKLFKLYLEDSLVANIDDDSYIKSLEPLKKDSAQALKIVVNALAKIKNSYDKKLLIDQLLYDLSKRGKR